MTTACSWCSAEIPDGATECPSCGANLISEGDPNVPGVTAVDAASIIRSRSAPPPRNRLLSWISGESATDLPSKAEAQAIAPPDLEVRREILRLELQAEVANLRAEADALRAEAAAEGRTLPEFEMFDRVAADAAEEPAGSSPEGVEAAAQEPAATESRAAAGGGAAGGGAAEGAAADDQAAS